MKNWRAYILTFCWLLIGLLSLGVFGVFVLNSQSVLQPSNNLILMLGLVVLSISGMLILSFCLATILSKTEFILSCLFLIAIFMAFSFFHHGGAFGHLYYEYLDGGITSSHLVSRFIKWHINLLFLNLIILFMLLRNLKSFSYISKIAVTGLNSLLLVGLARVWYGFLKDYDMQGSILRIADDLKEMESLRLYQSEGSLQEIIYGFWGLSITNIPYLSILNFAICFICFCICSHPFFRKNG